MRVSASLANPGSAKRLMTRKLEEASRREANNIGIDMRESARAFIRSNYDTNRPGSRRRHPGTTHADDAIDFQVDGSTFPITVRYRVSGGDAVVARVIFMNYGTRPHMIYPGSGEWGGKGFGGPIPIPERASRPFEQKLAWFEDGYWHVADEVDHPGQEGRHFLEKARDEAVKKNLHG